MARTSTLEQQLPTVENVADLRVLSEGLADEDPTVREECAQRLAALKNPEAAPFLRHALDDDDAQVRVWGAYGLGLLAREQDKDELLRASQDESPLVRIWATFGRANAGDAQAVAQLISFLDLPDLELRSNVADALLSLGDASISRPLLEKRLAVADERKRVWAAAVLHRLGHRDAFGVWRDGLVNPDTRADAAMVAPHLRTAQAARELVRVTAELTQDELDAPVAAANDLPLAELLTSPLHDLDLDALLASAKKDAALRSDLLLLVLRSPAADPEVLAQLYEFANGLEPAALGRDLAAVLSEQDPKDRPWLMCRLVDFPPEAITATLEALESADREQLFDAIAEEASNAGDDNASLEPLLELLRTTRFAEQFADLPAHPWGEPSTDIGVETVRAPEALSDEERAELDSLEDEDDVALLIERLAAGEELTAEEREKAEQTLEELGMSAAEFLESLNAELESDVEAVPPEASQVALRALALGAMIERARMEKTRGSSKALRSWMETEGVLDILTALELDLLDAELGDWLDEDVELAEASAEALGMLLWSVGLAPLPPSDKPVNVDETLKKLPLLASTEKLISRATLKDPEELERQRELWETWLWRAEQEELARLALSGEEIEAELDLDAILEDLVADGFDADAARKRGGDGAVKAEALRFLGRKAAQKLSEEKLLTLVNGDFAFRGKALGSITDEDLAQASVWATERHRALNWVLSGGDWDDLPVDEDGDGG